jgi:hypothetical protein
MQQETKYDRRSFLGSAAMSIAAAKFVAIDSAPVESGRTKASSVNIIKPATNPSFGPLKQLDAGLLSVGYAEAGSANGRPIILLHGWPYDIHTYVDVAPLLVAKGYRVFVPYLRGYGRTRFLSTETIRNAQPSALASDIVALMDALKIDKAIIGGCDWERARPTSLQRSGPIAVRPWSP